MQYFRSLLCLLLGVASSGLALAEPGVPGPVEHGGVLVARDFDYFWAQAAPKDLNKRQTPEEVCGVNYVLCDPTHCCQAGTYCERRPTGWFCPVVSGRSTVVYESTTNYPTSYYSYIPTVTRPNYTVTRSTDYPSPTDDPDDVSGGTKKKKKGGLGTGAIIGIVVAVVILGIIAAVSGFFYIRSKKKAALLPAPPMQSAPQQPYTAPPEPQQQYGVPPPQGYYPPQGQYPPQEQYSQYPQGPYTAPQSPAPQYQHGYAAPPVGDNAMKGSTPEAGYYQPGHSGAVEAMSEPARSPAPPQGQTQAPPPPKPNVYEI